MVFFSIERKSEIILNLNNIISKKNRAKKYYNNLQNILSKYYKKNDLLYHDNTKNKMLFTILLYNIINKFLASKFHYLLEKKIKKNKFLQYYYNITILLCLEPSVFQ